MSIGPLMDECIANAANNTMECYSAIKRKEFLKHTTTWVNLEDVVLSEIRQSLSLSHTHTHTHTHTLTYFMIPLMWGL